MMRKGMARRIREMGRDNYLEAIREEMQEAGKTVAELIGQYPEEDLPLLIASIEMACQNCRGMMDQEQLELIESLKNVFRSAMLVKRVEIEEDEDEQDD